MSYCGSSNIEGFMWISSLRTVTFPREKPRPAHAYPTERLQPDMFRICDTIRSTQTQDGTIVLNVHHGEIFCLNVVGSKILELLRQGHDESRIADEISREYGTNWETVRRDVLEFIEALYKNHLIQPIRSADIT